MPKESLSKRTNQRKLYLCKWKITWYLKWILQVLFDLFWRALTLRVVSCPPSVGMSIIRTGIARNVLLKITILTALLTCWLAKRVLRSRKKTSSVPRRVCCVLKDLNLPPDITRCVFRVHAFSEQRPYVVGKDKIYQNEFPGILNYCLYELLSSCRKLGCGLMLYEWSKNISLTRLVSQFCPWHYIALVETVVT